MKKSGEWFNDEDFWRRAYPFLFSEERFQAAILSADKLVTALGVSADAAVLDLCSGPGRFAVPLAQRGCRVTAVDRTRFYLDRLRARATDAGVDIELVCEDMRRFRRESSFDAVINMYTSFGYFKSTADDRKVLKNVYASLKPGGTYVMEMMSREVAAKIFQERDWMEVDGRFLLEEHRVDPDFGGTHDRWIVLDEDGKKEFVWSLRLYTGTELCAMIRSVGFSEAIPYGDLEGKPYDNRANRLCIVARK